MAKLPSVPKGVAAQERKWRAESNLGTITQAEMIKRDAGAMRDVRALAKQKQRELSSIAGSGGTRARTAPKPGKRK